MDILHRFTRLLLLLLACAVAAPLSAAVTRWTLVDLGPMSYATAINGQSEVAGYSYEGGRQHAFLFTRGSLVDIGVPPNGVDFFPKAINDAGQVVGYDFNGGAWSWIAGEWTDLGFQGQPTGINKRGDIVGYRTTASADVESFILRDGALTVLRPLGGRSTWALSINDRGQVAGIAQRPDEGFRAVVWEDGALTDMGTFNGNGSGAEDINNHGEVIGLGLGQNVYFGGWFFDGTMQPIGGTSPLLFPRALNDRGVVVGEVAPASGKPWPGGSFIWEHGIVTRLDLLPEVIAAGYYQVSATDINDRGWITVIARKDGTSRSFLMIPKVGGR